MAFRTDNGKNRRLGKMSCAGRVNAGFTMIELMVVLAMVALLMTIALPRYFDGLQRTREAVLRQDLKNIREAIDHFHADRGQYPTDLAELVEKKYLRELPYDPITERNDTWIIVNPPDYSRKMLDIQSGAPGVSSYGSPYSSW